MGAAAGPVDPASVGLWDTTAAPWLCHTGAMHILVTASSKHGSTEAVANAIALRLREAGHAVDRRAPEDVTTLDGFDAVVCGSAVYILQWMKEAREFIERFSAELSQMPVWAFSVGMSGVPKHAPQDPSRIGPLSTHVPGTQTRFFAGRYDPALLTLRERSVARLAGVVEGDFRDWDAVGAWADSIAGELAAR